MKRNNFRLVALCLTLAGCSLILLADMIVSPTAANHDFWLGFCEGAGGSIGVLGIILFIVSIFRKDSNVAK